MVVECDRVIVCSLGDNGGLWVKDGDVLLFVAEWSDVLNNKWTIAIHPAVDIRRGTLLTEQIQLVAEDENNQE